MADDDKKVEKQKMGGKRPTEPKKSDRDNINETHTFRINGVEIQSPQQKPAALDILKLAKDKGAIPRKPDEYILQGKKTQYKPIDRVNLSEGDEFITIPNTPTSVA